MALKKPMRAVSPRKPAMPAPIAPTFKKGGPTSGDMKAKGRNMARIANQRGR